MRSDIYMPLVNNAAWEVRLAIAGNIALTSSYVQVFKRQQLLLRAIVHGQTYTAKTVRVESTVNAFPDVDYSLPNPTNANAEITIDLTPYIAYMNAGSNVVVRFVEGSLTAGIPAIIALNGISPAYMTGDKLQVCECTGGGGLSEPIYMYGSIPRVACVGDMVEVVAPLIVHRGTENDYAAKITADRAALGIIPRAWCFKKINGTIIGGGKGISGVLFNSAGLAKLYGTNYVWSRGAQSYTSYTDEYTGLMIRIERVEDCIPHVRLYWRTRTGSEVSSVWEIAQEKDATGDEVQLATLSGEYDGMRGGSRSLVLRKRGLTAADMWYYSSIVLSNYVRASIDGGLVSCKMLTKSVDIPTTDVGKTYDLEIELQTIEYGAL